MKKTLANLATVAFAGLLLVGEPMAGDKVTMPSVLLENASRFSELDTYLAYLAEGGAMDRPYFLEIEPELYRLIRGRASAGRPPELYTREQLLELFGFDR